MTICNGDNRELENKMLDEFVETAARRQKLEQALLKLDAIGKQMIEKAAHRDIEAHRKRRPAAIQSLLLQQQSERQAPAILSNSVPSVCFVETSRELPLSQAVPLVR